MPLLNVIRGEQYTIGLIYVPSRAYHERFSNEFKQKVDADKRFKIVEFGIASADLMLASATCNVALEHPNVNVFVTVGLVCSQIMVQQSLKRKKKTPIVFMGVDDPVGLGLVDSLDMPGHNVTGVFSDLHAVSMGPLDLLLLAKPDVQSILLPFAVVADGNERQAQTIKIKCNALNVKVDLLPINDPAETLARVSALLPGHDCLMYLESDLIAAHGPGLGKLASQNGITMFASSPDGVADSVLAYSANPAHFALHVFALVKRIVIDNESPATISVQKMDRYRDFIVNTKFLVNQDLARVDFEKISYAINTEPVFDSVRGHFMIL